MKNNTHNSVSIPIDCAKAPIIPFQYGKRLEVITKTKNVKIKLVDCDRTITFVRFLTINKPLQKSINVKTSFIKIKTFKLSKLALTKR
jgi:hypothetical protein